MIESKTEIDINELIKIYSAEFDTSKKETSIILAAGHGKRIKSHRSKMLHKIWGEPTVSRVFDACAKGLKSANIIVVIGIKAENVIETVGKREYGSYAYQAEQQGTGHAVQVALEKIENKNYDGIVYVFPGDMGLVDEKTVSRFKDEFHKSNSDMMVLTGLFEGDYKENYYGRIVRVKETDVNGNKSPDAGQVIKIMEHKDILSLSETENHIIEFKEKKYAFTRQELLENNEFNSGVFAFKYKYLAKLINEIESNNVQGEIYLTDLIHLFNEEGLSVGAVSPIQQHVIMGFNNKSVLKEMEKIARNHVYDKIKDIIEIEDEEDFYIADDVVEKILEMDSQGTPLDIHVGRGAFICKGVSVNYGCTFGRECIVKDNIVLGKNVNIGEGVEISCFQGQQVLVGDNVEIMKGDIIKGNITIGNNSRIESSVNMTGSDDYPVTIGNNVEIKGTTYIFGSKIADNILIYHSVLVRKNVINPNKDGSQFKIGFYIPEVIGREGIKEI
ncbi:MAG: NTP transferase domain-containing protein [Melioribacteraceae bacterium]|nr:MAG: NTP transferase domain-containing protein [Melioribacteraceae bacterium]